MSRAFHLALLLAMVVANAASPGCALPEQEVVCRDSQGLGELTGEASCDLCISSACCEVATRCAAEPDCVERIECMKRCGREARDPACYDRCKSPSYDGTTVFELYECAAAQCDAECTFGREFGCYESYEWPNAEAAKLDLRLHIFDDNSQQGFEGITVDVCGPLDPSCSAPTGSSVTDGDGRVNVEVAAIESHGGTYAGWSGHMLFTPATGSGDDFFDAVFVRSRPEWRQQGLEDNVPLAPKQQVLVGLGSAVGGVDGVDMTKGQAVGAIQDCYGLVGITGARGIRVSTDVPNGGVRYIDGFFPTTNDFTGTDGRFVVANIEPADAVVFLFQRIDTGETIASLSAPVLAGHVTILGVWPDAK